MPRNAPRVTLAVALTLALLARGASACVSSADCSHLGECSASSGLCICDAGWAGATCASLDLLPAPVDSGLRQSNSSNWCGALVRDPADASLLHLLSADFGGCAGGLSIWLTGSRVIHATASSPLGPFAPAWAAGDAEVAVRGEAHNPQVSRQPDGTYVLFDSYGGPDAGCPLEANYTTCRATGPSCAPKMPPGGGPGEITFHTAATPAGPWAPVTAPIDYPCFSKNLTPAPFVHPNGTLFVIFHCDADATHNMGDLVMVRADSWRGPFTRVNSRVWNAVGVAPHPEDPFAFTRTSPTTGEVSWHVILHNTPRGIHLVSTDGFTFELQHALGPDREPVGPFVFSENITQADGTVFRAGRRERPFLLFDERTSRPRALVTSMQASVWPRVFTHIQGVA